MQRITGVMFVGAGVLAACDRQTQSEPRTAAPAAESPATAVAQPLSLTCTHAWAAPVSGDFSDPANWSPAEVPIDTAVACIDVPGSYTVTLTRSDDPTVVGVAGLVVGPASGHAALVLTGNSLHLDAAQGIDLRANGEMQLTAAPDSGIILSAGGSIQNAGLLGSVRGCPTCGVTDVIRGNVANQGTVHVATNVALDATDGTYSNAATGTTIIDAGASITVPAGIGAPVITWNGGSLSGAGRFLARAGSVVFNAGTAGLLASGDPALQLDGASLALGTPQSGTASIRLLGNAAGTTGLSGSTAVGTTLYIVADTIPAGSVTWNGNATNAGTLRLWSGAGRALQLAGTGTLTNTGTVFAGNDPAGVIRLSMSVVNSTGTLTLGSDTWLDRVGGKSSNAKTINGTAGRRLIVGTASTLTHQSAATVAAAVTLEVRGGTLKGKGTIPNLQNTNGGSVEPGPAIGLLTVKNYAQDAASTLHLEINGVGANTQYDRVAITGTATFDGRLDVINATSFTGGGVCGQGIDVITGGIRTGAFASVTGTAAATRGWHPAYLPTAVRLTGYDPSQVISYGPLPTTLAEGGAAATYNVCLGPPPSGDVTLAVTSPDSQMTSNLATILYSGATWPLPKPVAVSAINDHIFELSRPGTTQHTASSTDVAYAGKSRSFAVNVTDAQMPKPYVSTLNLAYGTASTYQKLDIHRPTVGTNFPTVVYIHGYSTDKSLVKSTAPIHAIDSGWAVVAINYSPTKNQSIQNTMMDVKQSVRWLRAHAAQYKLDPQLLIVWGSSEGGQYSSLMDVTCGVTLFGLGTPDECPTAATTWFGAEDLSRFQLDLALDGCPPKSSGQTDSVNYSPLHYVQPGAPLKPLQMEQSITDCAVSPRQSIRMDSALVANAFTSAVVIHAGGGHGIRLDFWRTDSVYARTLGWIGKAFRGQV